MPRKPLRCGRCGRTFSRPAHLARHMSATHGRAKASRVARAKSRRGGPRAGAGKRDALAQLRKRLAAYAEELEAQFSALGRRVQSARAALRALGSSANGRRRRRRRR
jgi:hypothetical protein